MKLEGGTDVIVSGPRRGLRVRSSPSRLSPQFSPRRQKGAKKKQSSDQSTILPILRDIPDLARFCPTSITIITDCFRHDFLRNESHLVIPKSLTVLGSLCSAKTHDVTRMRCPYILKDLDHNVVSMAVVPQSLAKDHFTKVTHNNFQSLSEIAASVSKKKRGTDRSKLITTGYGTSPQCGIGNYLHAFDPTECRSILNPVKKPRIPGYSGTTAEAQAIGHGDAMYDMYKSIVENTNHSSLSSSGNATFKIDPKMTWESANAILRECFGNESKSDVISPMFSRGLWPCQSIGCSKTSPAHFDCQSCPISFGALMDSHSSVTSSPDCSLVIGILHRGTGKVTLHIIPQYYAASIFFHGCSQFHFTVDTKTLYAMLNHYGLLTEREKSIAGSVLESIPLGPSSFSPRCWISEYSRAYMYDGAMEFHKYSAAGLPLSLCSIVRGNGKGQVEKSRIARKHVSPAKLAKVRRIYRGVPQYRYSRGQR